MSYSTQMGGGYPPARGAPFSNNAAVGQQRPAPSGGSPIRGGTGGVGPRAAHQRSQGMQTDLPMANASVTEAKVYFRIVYGDKVLQFKLGWQSPLQVLFCKLDIRADFVWHGIVLDETLSPQHYNMLPGEENTVTVHVMRSDTRTTTHQEDMIINDAIRAMGLKLRLQEEKTASLQNENDELQGQIYALHREISDLNNAASQMLEEERAKTQVASAENTRLIGEVEELRIQLDAARKQLANRENVAAKAAQQQASRVAASSARTSPVPSRTASTARASTKQARPLSSGPTPQKIAPRATSPRAGSKPTNVVPRGATMRETQMTLLRNELSAWQTGIQRTAKPPVTDAASRESHDYNQSPSMPMSEWQHPAKTGSPARAGVGAPSASPVPETPHDFMQPPPDDHYPTETVIKCVFLNEQSGVQKKLPPLKGPPSSTVTVAEAIEMLRERHGSVIPPMTSLMACVQRAGSAEYDVVDTNIAPNLHRTLQDGDTFFVANMAA